MRSSKFTDPKKMGEFDLTIDILGMFITEKQIYLRKKKLYGFFGVRTNSSTAQ